VERFKKNIRAAPLVRRAPDWVLVPLFFQMSPTPLCGRDSRLKRQKQTPFPCLPRPPQLGFQAEFTGGAARRRLPTSQKKAPPKHPRKPPTNPNPNLWAVAANITAVALGWVRPQGGKSPAQNRAPRGQARGRGLLRCNPHLFAGLTLISYQLPKRSAISKPGFAERAQARDSPPAPIKGVIIKA